MVGRPKEEAVKEDMFKQSGKAGPKLVEATIVGLAQGGDAVAKEEGAAETSGRTLFVFGAAPKEKVRLRIIEERPRFARGEIVEIVTPSPTRRAPLCPLFGKCGGCDWQHLPYEEQASAKEEMVARALTSIAPKVEISPMVRAPEEYHYRARTRLHFRREGQKVSLGYFARGSTTIVEVKDCPLLSEPLQKALGNIRGRILTDLTGSGTITLLGETPLAAEIFCEAPLDAQRVSRGVQKKQAQITLPAGPFGAISVSSPQGVALRVGAEGVPILYEEKAPLASGRVFSQANPEVNARLREAVVSLVGEQKNILELYAGAGNLTLSLLRAGAKVLAVEFEQEASRWLRQNTRADFAMSCDVRQGEAAVVAKRLAEKGERFDAVVLDPPRSGAAPVLESIAKLSHHVVYVSCDLSSLARDAQTLLQRGFQLTRALSFDMFPQSAHVETVALFTRVVAQG